MLYREVPKNGDKLSVLGYGCMRFPVRMNTINEKLAERQILHAMDRGVNYYDTAYPYHSKKSDPLLGKILARNNCRGKVKVRHQAAPLDGRFQSGYGGLYDQTVGLAGQEDHEGKQEIG